MNKRWILAGFIVAGVSVGLSFAAWRDWNRSLTTSLISLTALGCGIAATGLDSNRFRKTGSRVSSRHAHREPSSLSPLSMYPRSFAPSEEGANHPIAIFWDYENVKISAQGLNAPLAETLMDYARSLGHPCRKTVYANWRRESDVVVKALYSLGFEPIHVSMGKPNSVDIKLTVDCLNTAYRHPYIQKFIVVTADKDFIPLVHALKAMEKQVIIIGRTDVVSEQLMLSADDFVSLEQLSKDAGTRIGAKIEGSSPSTLSYQDAIDCLMEAIGEARDQGKSTRFPILDRLMRASLRYRYQGVASIRKPDGSTFASFSKFIAAAEKDGKVQIQTVEGFKEVFLIEEDPLAESDFSPRLIRQMERDHWQILVQQVERAFQEGDPNHYLYGRFSILFKYVREAKKSGILPLSNQSLQIALNQLVEVGVLADGSFRLIENLDVRKEDFLDRLSQS
jgi:uncharacterized protein (TIGR00288 family)